MSPFQKGHKGYKTKGKPKANKKKVAGNNSLDTYYFSISRFKKKERGQMLLDPELVDYYINNDLDLRELYGEDGD